MNMRSVTFAIDDFDLPPPGAPRYLSIDTRDGKRHHVEMFSQENLHPTDRSNVYIWAASNLKEVRKFFARLFPQGFGLCLQVGGGLPFECAIFGFFWVGHWPSALHDFSDEEHLVRPSLGYPRAEPKTGNPQNISWDPQAHDFPGPGVWIFLWYKIPSWFFPRGSCLTLLRELGSRSPFEWL
jgi:hypothetical protein